MTKGILCNDTHSKLNPTRVAKVIYPTSIAEVASVVRETAANGGQLSICGARHAMGGQQFGEGTVLVDCSLLTDIGPVDLVNGWVELGAGVKWRDLIDALLLQQDGLDTVFTIRQKQTGADDLTIAGSLSANAHGRGLRMRPIIDDVEAFTLIDSRGAIRRCCREENPEIFRLAIGGYGCFGIITSVCLRLSPRLKLRRSVEVTTVDLLLGKLGECGAAGGLYGDFQFSIDENSPDFLNRGVLSTYQPVDACLPLPVRQEGLDEGEWMRLLRLAHDDRAKVFDEYSGFYLRTHGGLYWSDTHQLSVYIDDYHSVLDDESCAAVPASEMISELYVPRERLVAFMAAAANDLRKSGVPVIYGTVRLVEKDPESLLAWAREDFACVIFNLHTEHREQGIAKSAAAFRALIDDALALGGSFFLTYHRWATRSQIEQAYPQFSEFLRQKELHDPEGLLQSEWWRHHRDLFSAS